MKTLICGPMYSGKSTELLRNLERRLLAKQNCLLIRPKKDDRPYFTHNSDTSLERLLVKYSDIFEILEIERFSDSILQGLQKRNLQAIFVDEYFMISDIHKLALQDDYDVYFGGLLATSEAKLFEETEKILPYCENIQKLTAVCTGYKKDSCGGEANFSVYIGKDKKTSEVLVDSDDSNYICLCSKCYETFLKEK